MTQGFKKFKWTLSELTTELKTGKHDSLCEMLTINPVRKYNHSIYFDIDLYTDKNVSGTKLIISKAEMVCGALNIIFDADIFNINKFTLTYGNKFVPDKKQYKQSLHMISNEYFVHGISTMKLIANRVINLIRDDVVFVDSRVYNSNQIFRLPYVEKYRNADKKYDPNGELISSTMRILYFDSDKYKTYSISEITETLINSVLINNISDKIRLGYNTPKHLITRFGYYMPNNNTSNLLSAKFYRKIKPNTPFMVYIGSPRGSGYNSSIKYSRQEIKLIHRHVSELKLYPIIHESYGNTLNKLSDNLVIGSIVRKSKILNKIGRSTTKFRGSLVIHIHNGIISDNLMYKQNIEILREVASMFPDIDYALELNVSKKYNENVLMLLYKLFTSINDDKIHKNISLCVDTAHFWGLGIDITTVKKSEDFFDILLSDFRVNVVHLNVPKKPFGQIIDRHGSYFEFDNQKLIRSWIKYFNTYELYQIFETYTDKDMKQLENDLDF